MASNPPSESFAHVLPDRWTILGFRLHPLTIGHAVLLERVGSPLAIWLTGDCQAPTAVDLLLALRICSMPPAVAERWIASPGAIWKLKWSQWRFALQFNGVVRSLVLTEKLIQFNSYLAYGLMGPRCLKESNTGRKSGASVMRRLFSFLVCTAGMSRADAMSTPINDALWHFAAHWEMHGTVQIQNDRDDDLVAAALAVAAKQRTS